MKKFQFSGRLAKSTMLAALAVTLFFTGCPMEPKEDPYTSTDISYTAVQVGGTAGTTDSTGIILIFSAAVTDLTAGDITIVSGTGAATKGTLTGNGTTWAIALSAVTTEGNVTVFIAKLGIEATAKPVAVYKADEVADITYTAVQTGGVSGTTDSTGITLTFDAAVTDLTADDITITNGTGAATKGALTGNDTTWTIALSAVPTPGTVNVSITKPGIEITAKPVAVYKAGEVADITYTAVQAGGAPGTTTSTGITLTFVEALTSLTAGDITIANGTGAATKGTLTGGGTTWTIPLTAVAEGNVTVFINKAGIETAAKTVAVYKADISYTAAQVGGTAGTTDSTGIILTFNETVTGLTEGNITIAGGTGAATKGALTGSGTTWTIALTAVTTPGTVTVSITKAGIETAAKTVAVYKTAGSENRNKLTITGISGISGPVFVVLVDELIKDPNVIAGGSASISGGTVTIPLQTISGEELTGDWTGTGSYYMYLWNSVEPSGLHDYVTRNGKINFSTETISVAWSKFVKRVSDEQPPTDEDSFVGYWQGSGGGVLEITEDGNWYYGDDESGTYTVTGTTATGITATLKMLGYPVGTATISGNKLTAHFIGDITETFTKSTNPITTDPTPSSNAFIGVWNAVPGYTAPKGAIATFTGSDWTITLDGNTWSGTYELDDTYGMDHASLKSGGSKVGYANILLSLFIQFSASEYSDLSGAYAK
ncbi:putative lipoprotein [Treponema primitia ZAS-2]|uniref:Putative lipoprotein n=1 Tax=Treponema primitia (strain ATCC BAA-887 / DSM 12427 / ZAS-2) TaxID=545694 RepID=F5YH85_TREPZ|nr:lipoprotein [Treponema primitia]AEF86282.1 putative lipoprotein [Treponema primitia ZAS-2]